MIKIMEVWAHRNAWAPAGTFGCDQIDRSQIKGSVLTTDPCHASNDEKLIESIKENELIW